MFASWSCSAHARMHGSTSSCGSPRTSSPSAAPALASPLRSRAAVSCSQRTVRAKPSPHCSTSTSCRTEESSSESRASASACRARWGRERWTYPESECATSSAGVGVRQAVRGAGSAAGRRTSFFTGYSPDSPTFDVCGRPDPAPARCSQPRVAQRRREPGDRRLDARGRDAPVAQHEPGRPGLRHARAAARRPRPRPRRAPRSPCAAAPGRARPAARARGARRRRRPRSVPPAAHARARRPAGRAARRRCAARGAGGGRARPDAIRCASASWSSAGEPASAASFSVAIAGASAAGARIQPSRSAGASVLDAVPDVHDPRGIEPLQRGERPAVVAELGVVVVLDHEPVAGARPRQQRVAPLRPHHRAGRELVAGRDRRRRRRPTRRAHRPAARRRRAGSARSRARRTRPPPSDR